MKTQAINWTPGSISAQKRAALDIPNAGYGLRVALYLLSGAIPFALISVLAIWLTGSGGAHYVSAASWAAGFVFLALAVENGRARGLLHAGAGLALMTLAWLASRVAPEFGVLAGVVLAAWAAVPAMKCVAFRNRG